MDQRSPVCLLLCAVLCMFLASGGCTVRQSNQIERSDPESVPVEEQNVTLPVPDFHEITAHLELPVTAELSVTRPDGDITTAAETQYITGASDPDAPLLLNGEAVESRGSLGSFGVFVDLEEGENVFAFTNDDQAVTLTITRAESEGYGTTDAISRPMPESDTVVREGEPITLSCVAPSGGEVTASVGGLEVAMEQKAATVVEGVPATFTGEFDPGEVEGTVRLGTVTYTLTWKDETVESGSNGVLYGLGKDASLIVRAKEVSSTTFNMESDEGGYATTLQEGAVDIAEEIGSDMYKLSAAGWVFKDAVEPLTEDVSVVNEVSSVEYIVSGDGETLLMKGTATTPYRAERSADALVLTFARTTGVGAFDTKGSALFDGGSASLSGEDGVALTFTLRKPDTLWGYQVEYRENDTLISFSKRPELQEGDQPLTGINILLDPGHGGSDDGASSVAGSKGPVEKDINLATAQAVEKYLRSLGAAVSMTRDDDSKVEKYDLMSISRNQKPDLMISLHCNSISYTLDGTDPSGVEVYYREAASKALAEALVEKICGRTGRNNRSAKESYYWITLNSYAPTVMVEMGFLTNPVEYDDMRGEQGIYDMAYAVGEGVVTLLSKPDKE